MMSELRKLGYILGSGNRVKLAVIFCLLLVGGGLEMIGIGLFLPFLQLMINPAKLASLPYFGPYLTFTLERNPADLVLPACFLMLGFYVVKNIFLAWLNWINFRFVFASEARLQIRLLSAYFRVPFELIARRNSAELIRTAYVSTKVICQGIVMSVLGLVMEGILAAAAVLTLFLIEPIGALTVAALMLALVGMLYFPLRRFMTRWGQQIQLTAAELLKSLQQSVGIQKEARVAGREAHFISDFARISHLIAGAYTKLLTTQQLPRFVAEVVVLAALLAYLLIAASRPGNVGEALPVLGLFGAASLRLLPSANRIIMHLGNIRQGKSAIDLVYGDLAAASESSAPNKRPAGEASFNRELRLTDISYRYPHAGDDALKQVNLVFPKGSAVALVGSSGAGKSTLADLLLGLLPPCAGGLYIDGQPLVVDNPEWRKRLGYVPQHIFLLDDTIRRNIAFGQEESDIDDQAIQRAVVMAGLGKVVEDLPQGLDTLIGERGSRLSGGQRQRIGIARALYHQPDIIVFDEATSALDGGTERDIVDAIESLRGKITLVVIAHRMSTVMNCDLLVHMENGRVIDQGTYGELASRSAAFQKLAALDVA
ncbi:MAG: ABC transporter ATP-binding protein [Rhodospirillales bacterium]|jgi:ATP-binding cassette subfamily C protein